MDRETIDLRNLEGKPSSKRNELLGKCIPERT